MESRSAEDPTSPSLAGRGESASLERHGTAGWHADAPRAHWMVVGVVGTALFGLLVQTEALDLVPSLFAGFAVAAIAALALLARAQQRTVERILSLLHERERAAETLRRERDMAADSNLSKTRFFAAASHDLRQPLHALTIDATTLRVVADQQHDPVIRELSDNMHRALDRSNGLLDSLLDVSRLDVDGAQVKLEAVPVLALLHAVKAQFDASAKQRGLSIEVHGAPDVTERDAVLADRALMFRVMSNLMSNAVRFTDEGAIRLSVSRSHEAGPPAASWFVIEVADSGCGIDAVHLPRIFEEFYRVRGSSQRAGDGLGLGLSIVRRAAELMAMSVTAQSTPGVGTTMSLRCPVAIEAPAQAWARDDRTQSDEEGTDFGSSDLVLIKALLLQSPGMSAPLQRLLAMHADELRAAPDLRSALDLVDAGYEPTVLVIDTAPADEPSLLAAHRLMRALGRVAVIMVANADDAATAELARAGGMQLVTRPVDALDLAVALHRAVPVTPIDGAPIT